MAKIFPLIILCFSASFAFCQINVVGKLVDENYIPQVDFNVLLKSMNSSVQYSSQSNSEGNFSISANKGQYLMIISKNTEIYSSDTLTLMSDVNMGIFPIIKSFHLETVNVQGKKKLIERKHDRIVFNVEESLLSSGIGADELIKNVPRMDPSSDFPKIFGKSGVAVMVDEKILNLSGDDLVNFLKSLRSENIKQIEVILNPPSKFDAAGNSGILNIKLKKKRDLGFEGNAVTNYSQRTYPTINESLSLNYSKGKLLMKYNGFLGKENRITEYRNKYIFPNQTRQTQENGKRRNKGLSNYLALEYQISSKATLGTSLDFNRWNNSQDFTTMLNAFSPSGGKNSDLDVFNSTSESTYKVLNLSPFFELELDTIGKKIAIYYNYLSNKTMDDNSFSNSNNTPNTDISLNRNFNNDNFKINSFNIDLSLPLNILSIETGFKIASINTNNDATYYFSTQETTPNHFNYKEDILAVYLSMNKNIGNTLMISAGLRYEETMTKGNNLSDQIVTNNEYDNFFPSISLSYDPNDNDSFSLGYNKRIVRPTLDEINPFRQYQDQINYTTGNPFLLPSKTDNIELGYLFRGNLSISVFASKTTNNPIQFAIPLDDGKIVEKKPTNALTTYDIGGDIGFNWRKAWFNNYTSISVSHQHSLVTQNLNIPDKDLKGLTTMFSTNSSASLKGKLKPKIMLNAFYSLPAVEELNRSRSIFMVRLAGNISLMQERLAINGSLTDIFNTTVSRSKVDYGDFILYNRLFNDNQNFTISLSYKFGNFRAKSFQTKSNNSEKERLASNN